MMTQARRVELFKLMKPELKIQLLGEINQNNIAMFNTLIDNPNSIFYNFIEIF
jgi:hypothetical protein